eukprot:112350-Chlamydomonas_euryale.AAC.6
MLGVLSTCAVLLLCLPLLPERVFIFDVLLPSPSFALCHLQIPVEVHAVGLPVVKLGEAHAGGGDRGGAAAAPPPPLRVCYLRHAFGLGAHYNSVEPAVAAAGGEAAAAQ